MLSTPRFRKTLSRWIIHFRCHPYRNPSLSFCLSQKYPYLMYSTNPPQSDIHHLLNKKKQNVVSGLFLFCQALLGFFILSSNEAFATTDVMVGPSCSSPCMPINPLFSACLLLSFNHHRFTLRHPNSFHAL